MNIDQSRLVKLNSDTKLRPAMACAKRIAEVAHFLNDDLVGEYGPQGTFIGKLEGRNDRARLRLKYEPNLSAGFMIYTATMEHMITEFQASISLADLQNESQWQKMAQALGNRLLDSYVHKNDDQTGKGSGTFDEDPDIKTEHIAKAADKMDPVGKLGES